MLHTDFAGLEMTASSGAATEAWNDVVDGFLSHSRSTAGALDRLLTEDGDSMLGWSSKALMSVMMAKRELVDVAKASALRAVSGSANGTWRERRYAQAASAAADGRWNEAVGAMEQVLARYPDDAMAAKFSHGLRFMLGDSAGMLESIRALRQRVSSKHPHYGYLLGCETFALEEAGDYKSAELIGRRALELAPQDAWGLHAVAHVFEMTGRVEEGVAWIGSRRDSFAHCNNFAFHVWWHLALFHLARGETGRVLELYDERVRPEPTDDFRDVANAVSLLVRLDLAGVDVGSRFEELQAIAARRIADRCLVFADLHGALALARAGKDAGVISAFTAPADGRPQEQSEAACQAGQDAALGIAAFYAGRYEEAREALLRARPRMQSVGGSHAQRDVFEQLTIEACLRAGDTTEPLRWLEQRLERRNGMDAFAARRIDFLRKRLPQGEAGLGILVAETMTTGQAAH